MSMKRKKVGSEEEVSVEPEWHDKVETKAAALALAAWAGANKDKILGGGSSRKGVMGGGPAVSKL